MGVRILPLLLVAGFLLSGCAAKSQTETTTDAALTGIQVAATATTGVIRGVVVDEAVRPLAGVQLSVISQGKTLTTNSTASGGFGFQGLPEGTYFLKAHKLGYHDAQTAADVKAGISDPPITKVQLTIFPGTKPYFSAQSFKGFIECTSSVVAICGAPNIVSEDLLCPVFQVCQGNLTDDRFGWDFYYEPNATMIQSEIVWDSTQSASAELSLEMEDNDDGCTAASDAYVEDTAGPSPIYNIVDAKEIETGSIGGTCPIWHSLFSGGAAGTPAGVTVNQDYRAFSHSFYHMTPPDGWRFSKDGDPPQPA